VADNTPSSQQPHMCSPNEKPPSALGLSLCIGLGMPITSGSPITAVRKAQSGQPPWLYDNCLCTGSGSHGSKQLAGPPYPKNEYTSRCWAASSAYRSALFMSAKDLVWTRKSRKCCLKAASSFSWNMPWTHACKHAQISPEDHRSLLRVWLTGRVPIP